MDLENGIFYRLAWGKKQTNKRQPPNPIPERLLAHLKRWQSKGLMNTHFVEWNGKPIDSVSNSFDRAKKLAGIQDIRPHTLRHTCVTWLLQSGVSIWDTAGYVGMSPEMVSNVYGHHCPDHLQKAVQGITWRRPKSKK